MVENPVINIISFEGNDAITDDELRAEDTITRQRQVFTRSRVQSDVTRLYTRFIRRQGRFSVTIQPKIIQLDQNRVNLVFRDYLKVMLPRLKASVLWVTSNIVTGSYATLLRRKKVRGTGF